jgi:hypothetical protein
MNHVKVAVVPMSSCPRRLFGRIAAVPTAEERLTFE